MVRAIMAWISAHPLRTAVLGALSLSVLGCATAAPSNDRDWYPYLSRTMDVTIEGDRFHVAPVSDWTYTAEAPATQSYGEAAFNISDVRNVWFMLEPQPGSNLAAHTLLLFEFSDNRMLGLTIEARRERDEDYSAVRGAFNAFELAYVWAEARDLLTRRAVMLDHEVFVYPVNITPEQLRVLLTRVLARTESLEEEPRFYNTLFSNCTNELAKAAGFQWAPAFILTGTSDEYLFERGIIPGDSFEQAHGRSDFTAWIKAHNDLSAEGFDAALLAELRARNAN